MPDNRIAWVDALKGFGMVLVILGHMAIPELARRLIFSFHMPLFFFVSGYLYKNGFSPRWCLRKLDSLLVPYVIYGTLTLAIFVFVGKIDFPTGARMLLRGEGLGLTWFFSCMLLTELLGGALLKGGQKIPKWGLVTLVVFLAGLGWVVSRLGFPSCFKIDVVPMALAFWLSGWIFRGHVFAWYELLIAAAFASFFWIQRVDMNAASYGNGVLFFGTALGFVALLLWAFEKYRISWKPLTFIGERSLEFMCLHGIAPLLFTEVLLRAGIPVPKFASRIALLLLVVVLADLIHRRLPLLSGHFKVFQRILWRV